MNLDSILNFGFDDPDQSWLFYRSQQLLGRTTQDSKDLMQSAKPEIECITFI